MQIIITDLTRFKNQDKVCTAGVADDGTVIRPMPYLSAEKCRELDIHPGGILEGKFTLKNDPAPHVEDASYNKLTFNGACSKAEFREALESTLYPDISGGFGVQVQSREKCIPFASPPVRSLITIKINPLSFSIVQDSLSSRTTQSSLFRSGWVRISVRGGHRSGVLRLRSAASE